MTRPADLPTTWRAHAALLRTYGAASQAQALEAAAGELEAAIAATGDELLTLEQAATEGGWTVRQLRHLLTTDRVKNSGSRGAPRIARRDLPMRPGHTPAPAPHKPAEATKSSAGGFDPDAFARRLAGGRRAS